MNRHIFGLVALCGALCLTALAACGRPAMTVHQFPSTPDAIKALRGGTVQAVYGDYPAMAYAARESMGNMEVVHRQFRTANFGMAMDSGATELHAAMAAALAAAMADRSYIRILTSWALEGGRIDAPEGTGELPEASSVPQLADGTLTIGMEITFPPMGFHDEARQLAGVDIELARQLGRALGVEVEFEGMPFDDLFGALDSGRVDIAMSAITVTEERRGQVHLLDYMQSGSAILVQSGNPRRIEYPDELCGVAVGVQEGTVQVNHVEAVDCD